MSPLWLLIPVIILWWVFVFNVVSLMSGWWSLSSCYRAREPFSGTRFRLRTGKLCWSNYGACLTIGVNADGLYLAVFFFMRPGHPPLFIPWSEIDATPVKGWIFRYLDFRFPAIDWRSQHPNLAKLFEKLSARPSFVDTAPKA